MKTHKDICGVCFLVVLEAWCVCISFVELCFAHAFALGQIANTNVALEIGGLAALFPVLHCYLV